MTLTQRVPIAAAIVIFALAPATAGPESADVVTLTATIHSVRYRIGDRIPVSIRAQCGADVVGLEPLRVERLAPFEILTIQPDSERPARSPCDRAWTVEVTTFDAGSLMIPAVPVRYRRTGASGFETVSTKPIALSVEAPAIDPSGDLKPLKPVITAPSSSVRPWLVSAAAVAALIAALAALAALAVWLRRIARGIRARGPSEPARRRHILARIAKLEHELPESEAAVEPFYTNLSRLIREFIELTCGVSALTISSSELVESLRGSQTAPLVAEVEKLVRFIDHVKFGGGLPPSSEHAKAVGFARQLLAAIGGGKG